MRSPTKYKFRHYRTGEDGLHKLIWASNGPGLSAGLDDGIVKGSELDLEFKEAQLWTPNELANEGEIAILEAYFGSGTAPASLYLRLYNDTILDADTLALIDANETSGTGYGALTLTKNTDWGAAAAGPTGITSVEDTFTAGGTWTDATALVLADVASGTAGDLIAWADLSTTRQLEDTDTLDVTMTVALD